VVVVNEAFVRHFLPGKPAIGRLLEQMPPSATKPPVEIVGVVADAVYRSVRDPVPPTMYLSLAQYDRPLTGASLSVRSAGTDPSPLIRPLAAAIAAVDRNLEFTVRPLADQVRDTLVRERLLGMLAGFFGVVAVLLAGLGLYAVTSSTVSGRRSEIAIRMALGGQPGGVVRLMLWRASALVVTGVAGGGLASHWAARFLKALVYGPEPTDATTLVVGVAIVAVATVLGAWIPARRASRIDPVAALREV
jgi:hypothetical protein